MFLINTTIGQVWKDLFRILVFRNGEIEGEMTKSSQAGVHAVCMLQARKFQVVTSNLFAVRLFRDQSNLFVTLISRKDHGIRFQRYTEAGHGQLARANLRLFEPQYPARQLVLSAPFGAGRGERLVLEI